MNILNTTSSVITRQFFLFLFPIAIGTAFCCPCSSWAQVPDSSEKCYTLHFQQTIVDQFKPKFSAPYSGTNSLVIGAENVSSITSTFFLGVRLWKNSSLYFNPEIAGGEGLSSALGVAASSNGETFRVGDPKPSIYLARLFVKQIIPLSANRVFCIDDKNQLQGAMPDRYLSISVGQISVADFFDCNSYSHDPRTQFLSWGLMSNGAWDYPANTRGYTSGAVLEYVSPAHELRGSYALLPLEANGMKMNTNIGEAGAATLEYTYKYKAEGRPGEIKLLGFMNRANMGNYDTAIAAFNARPEIISTRKTGRTKYGFGVSWWSEWSDYLGCFIRVGWNDGINETWAFTEIDHTVSIGLSGNGRKCKREKDHWGIAYVVSGISHGHQKYLEYGGRGFMLGEGALNYDLEKLVEAYYSMNFYKKNIFLSPVYQFIQSPGYNKDRGPVNVFSLRVHTEF